MDIKKIKNLRQVKGMEKGVALIMSFFIMIIILAVIFSISGLLYSEIKIIRNMGNSIIAIFAADSGVEKVLYYDNKVLPMLPIDAENNSVEAVRGLCTMYVPNAISNPNACDIDQSPTTIGQEHSIFCDPQINPTVSDGDTVNHGDGCDPAKCDDCKIAFKSEFDDRRYEVSASVQPNGGESTFKIESLGIYGGTARKIKVFLLVEKGEDAIAVDGYCVKPQSKPQGISVSVYAHIKDLNNVPIDGDNSKAKIYKYATDALAGSADLTCYKTNGYDDDPLNPNLCENAFEYANGFWKGTWETTSLDATAYYATLEIQDTIGTPAPNKRVITNIPYCN